MRVYDSFIERLFSDLVNDTLTEFAYDADLAGLSYNFSAAARGLYVTLSGYNDKLHVLAKDVVERVKTVQIKADRLEVMKDQVGTWLPLMSDLSDNIAVLFRQNETTRIFSWDNRFVYATTMVATS